MKLCRVILVLAAATTAPATLAVPAPGGYDATARQPSADEQSALSMSSGTLVRGNEEADRRIHDRLSEENMNDGNGEEDEEKSYSYYAKPTDILDSNKPIPTAVLMELTKDKESDSDSPPPPRPTPVRSYSRTFRTVKSMYGKLFVPSTPQEEKKPDSSSSEPSPYLPFSSKEVEPESPRLWDSIVNRDFASIFDWVSTGPVRMFTAGLLFMGFLFLVSTAVVEVTRAVGRAIKSLKVSSASRRIQLHGEEKKLRAVNPEKEKKNSAAAEPA